jgi:hypothetical protein
MLLLLANDFGEDGVWRGHLSTVMTDGAPDDLTSGATVSVLVDDWPGLAYVLCADPEMDTLNLAIAGPRV